MILLSAPINKLGYGQAGLNFLKSLSKLTEVVLWPIGNIEADPCDHQLIRDAIARQSHYDRMAPSVRVFHQHDLAQHVGRGTHIGFPIFELDSFTERELHHLSSQSRLFVCSEWAANIVRNTVGPYQKEQRRELITEGAVCEQRINARQPDVRVVPLGIDPAIFFPSDPAPGPTIFLNAGKWEVRKGHDVLIETFHQTFKESDNVELWLLCNNPFLTSSQEMEWRCFATNGRMAKKVKIIDRLQTHTDVANLMRQATIGVFPARAEGWNLELLEMMACGRHVIATNYSAHTEFCNNKNCHLIDIDGVEPAHDGIWFKGRGNWAAFGESQKEQLSHYMKLLHEAFQAGNLTLNAEGVSTGRQFTWDEAARRFLNESSN